MTVFTTAQPDFAQAVCVRVGVLVPEATELVVDGESFRAELEWTPKTFSGTTIAAAITRATPRANDERVWLAFVMKIGP